MNTIKILSETTPDGGLLERYGYHAQVVLDSYRPGAGGQNTYLDEAIAACAEGGWHIHAVECAYCDAHLVYELCNAACISACAEMAMECELCGAHDAAVCEDDRIRCAVCRDRWLAAERVRDAAPDMLAALHAMLAAHGCDPHYCGCASFVAARAAVAKAEGKTA